MWVLYLILASLVSTMLPLPPVISPADPVFIGQALSKGPIIIWIMTVADTGWGYLTYLFTDKVMQWAKRIEWLEIAFKRYTLALFTPSEKTFRLGYRILYKEVDLNQYMDKYGKWFILAASATPLPFTLSIYAVGVSKYNKDLEFIISVLIGRGIKYTAIYYAVKLGLNIF